MNFVLDDTIRVPFVATANLRAFRRWTKSGNYPDRGDYFYLNSELWVDFSLETLLHNQLKGLFNIILGGLLLKEPLGFYFADRMRLVHVGADISCEPDGMFVSQQSKRAGRVTWEQGSESLEIIGSPDMVLEVVSSHSVQKDTVVLRELYAAAQIPEYWLVNPLGERVTFDILKLTSKGYTATRKSAGWVKSAVFGKSFRLNCEAADDDLLKCQLLVR